LYAKGLEHFGSRLCFLDQLKAGNLSAEMLWVFDKIETLRNIWFRVTNFEGELQMELVWDLVQC
jgi:hypothetical protein